MQPFRIVQAEPPAAPVLFDSPHSGRDYPADFGAAIPIAQLRRAEDAYVDELIEGASRHGITILVATVPRCYIDVNRAPDDVDPRMLSDPGPDWTPGEKSRRGLGLIRELVVPGVRVYDRKLESAEVERRIRHCYRPYHAALDRLADEIGAEQGRLLHIDWHSMKSAGNVMTPDGEGAVRPDFVIGDLHGSSADTSVTDLVAGLLRVAGFDVAVNTPYAGGRIVKRIGDPAKGVHSIQIEINRRLYLDEAAVTKRPGFGPLRDALERFAQRLAMEW